ncbi:MAG: leucine-rich repeat protein, partial [Paludibacteraceae bacterium]|nr:leucine-rich repeat protein [Paludibacteraceae bacterium]
SVTHIGEKAFYECKNLKVVIDNSEDNLKIGNEAFQECGSVTYTKNAIEQTEQ